MAIIVSNNSIQFGDFTLSEKADGFEFDGVIEAGGGLCDTRVFQGTVSGYMSGACTPVKDMIQKFSFASNSPTTDVGELVKAIDFNSGQSSDTHGYSSGGTDPTDPTGFTDQIEKFPFTSDAPSNDVGELSTKKRSSSGQSSIVNGFGYATAGCDGTPTGDNQEIDRFPFAADTPSTDIGNIDDQVIGASGQSSLTFGYTSGGCTAPGVLCNFILKFPFAVDNNPFTDVGDLDSARAFLAGQSSETHGYATGGCGSGGTNRKDRMDKFPFASDTNATDIANLTTSKAFLSGQSSTTDGYSSGGIGLPPSPTTILDIDKFPFASDTDAVDVGEMQTNTHGQSAGHQV